MTAFSENCEGCLAALQSQLSSGLESTQRVQPVLEVSRRLFGLGHLGAVITHRYLIMEGIKIHSRHCPGGSFNEPSPGMSMSCMEREGMCL